MDLYKASVTVVRAAVRELRTEGLVLGQPGKAVYVQDVPSPAAPSEEFVELTDQLSAMREVLGDFEARLLRLEKATGLAGRMPGSRARLNARGDRRP
jgi:DNA-binding FadR family transcriptional regulator